MSRKNYKKSQRVKEKVGKPPGSLIYVGDELLSDSKLSLTAYNDSEFFKSDINSIEELINIISNLRDDLVYWININGLANTEIVEKIADVLSIHHLISEDIVNVYHRPKAEAYSNYLFSVIKQLSLSPENSLEQKQISILLNEKLNLVITFQDSSVNFFDDISKRIESGRKVIRKLKGDYLFYVLNDFVVDQYYIIHDDLSNKIATLEEELLLTPTKDMVNRIQSLRAVNQEVTQILRSKREALNFLVKNEDDYFSEPVLPYLRDAHDHVVQLMESFDSAKDSLSSLFEIYLTSLSNKMNEVMKVLTMIATIFIPLTFIAGVYGMNFRNIPELDWEYGYPAIIFLMIIIVVALLRFFKRKEWL